MLSEGMLRGLGEQAGLGPFSFVLRPLDRGASLEIDPEGAWYPASMVKTPLAAVALVLAAEGALDLESPRTVGEANMTANDAHSPLVPGYETHVKELIWLAISRSDNVATNLLFDLVGRERATRIARERLGLSSTSFHRKLSGSEPLIEDRQWDGKSRNTHPPSDAAKLFELIALAKIPLSRFLEDTLFAQIWNDKLAAALQPGDRFAHKTGDTSEGTHDGGILYAGGLRYVVVLYTGLQSSERNDARIRAFMTALRPLFDSN